MVGNYSFILTGSLLVLHKMRAIGRKEWKLMAGRCV